MSTIPDPASTPASYVDFFAASGMSRFRHSVRSAGRWPVRLLKVQQAAHEDLDPATDELIVGLVLGGAAPARWTWDGGPWNRAAARLPGEIGVTPFGSTGLFQVDGPSQMLVLCLPMAGLRQVYGDGFSSDFGALHERYAHIPRASRLCIQMWRAAAHPGPVSDDVIEAAALELIGALKTQGRADGYAPSRRLSSRNMDMIESFIAERGPVETTAADLAQLLDMPARSFRRHFRHTVGKPPHAYLLEQRIKRGRSWLEDRDRALSRIALDLGFASQAHFSTEFTKQVGISPAKYRRFLEE